MALASFFEKAAMAANQVLQGLDYSSLADVLQKRSVGVIFDDEAANCFEGVAAADLAVNLLARLYPRLVLATEGTDSRRVGEKLIESAYAINPAIEISTNAANADVCLVIGGTKRSINVPSVYVGSDGWIVKLSSSSPVGSGSTTNPFGCCAAACFGTANVFRLFFSDYLPRAFPDRTFSMSLLDFEPNSANPSNPAWSAINLGESYLVGLGAIGNGAVWALARAQGLQGELNLIDHELIDLTNLQRYVLADQTSVEAWKVDVATAAFEGSSLRLLPHKQRWGDYLRSRGDCDLSRVAVAVDNANDRCAIQASLPRWIVNAWTQAGDLGISRHDFVGTQACLACLYFPDGRQRNDDERIADEIGLPNELMLVRKMLYTGEQVGRDFIERVAASLAVAVEPLLPFEGESLRVFYHKAICGGIVLRLGVDRQAKAPTEVPLAFQSALAGILLATELVAHAGELKHESPHVTTKIDLLHPIGQYLSLPIPKHPSGRCICQDKDYLAAYIAKHREAIPPHLNL